ncbi:hypothetical protein WS97_30135 [Burkholderia territorii]|nr:hypothetical protein WS97_30135 [Burkholderia territorii]
MQAEFLVRSQFQHAPYGRQQIWWYWHGYDRIVSEIRHRYLLTCQQRMCRADVQRRFLTRQRMNRQISARKRAALIRHDEIELLGSQLVYQRRAIRYLDSHTDSRIALRELYQQIRQQEFGTIRTEAERELTDFVRLQQLDIALETMRLDEHALRAFHHHDAGSSRRHAASRTIEQFDAQLFFK